LASAYGIIKNHGGMITVSSRLGHGARFDIYMPLSEKATRPMRQMKAGLSKGRETVLLVDDEQMILDVGTAMLSKLGYEVVAVNGGLEAIEKVRAMGTALDLVVLDLIMPGMDGGKIFTAIQEIRPDLPVLLSSGYALDGQAEVILQKGCRGFIQKPFNLTELSEHVRKVLDQG
jgi:CheY-like chemotaxis protein